MTDPKVSPATEMTPENGIAVIGMACRFPGAPDTEALWRNLREGKESVTFFSDQELLRDGVDAELLRRENYVKAGAILGDVDLFDAAFFGFTPLEARAMDPQHRIFMEVAWQALEDAGYDPHGYDGLIGMYAGSAMSSYLLWNLQPNRHRLGGMDFMEIMLLNDKDFLPTRVSYKLDLRGPSVSVQTACSTSLVAVHQACQSLLNGECDIALAGGVSISVPERLGYLHHEGSIISPDGHCRAFDAAARGTVNGNGAGLVVLRPLADALAAGDQIRAVIRGSAINNDGALKVGFTAPALDGQAAAISEALSVADVDPESITYVETHGTGTELGDPVEIAALTQAFDTDRRGFCAIGSVKTNFGHLNPAAGVAGLIKTVLAIERGEIPPSLHFERPNPKIDFDRSPFRVNRRLSRWRTNGSPRRAGVSSFGMGGTNAHVVLEQAPQRPPPSPSRPYQLLLLSARTPTALEAAAGRLADHLEADPEIVLADVAYTLQVGRRGFAHRRALVCHDREQAVTALRRGGSGGAPGGQVDPAASRPVVFLFPGQGAQYAGMGAGLADSGPAFAEVFDRCRELLLDELGWDLSELLERAREAGEPAQRLAQTAFAQPALYAVEAALARQWMEWGIVPEAMLGHSVGEYVAAHLAGVFTLEEGLRLVAARGRLMQEAKTGAMLAVGLAEAELVALLREEFPDLSLAAINAPGACVASGPGDSIAALERHLGSREIEHRRLHVSHAFHSAMMEPVLGRFAEILAQVDLKPPERPWLSNLSGTWIRAEEATDPAYWLRHLRQPVRFADGAAKLLEEPGSILLEVGPGRTLGSLVRRQAKRPAETVILSSLPHPREPQPALEFVLNALGGLWLAGAAVEWQGFWASESRRRVRLPTYPFERQRYWIETSAPVQAPRDGDREPVAASSEALGMADDRAASDLRAGLQIPYVAPRNPTETEIARLWSEVLGFEQVGIRDDFFALGGDSLVGTRLVARLRQKLDSSLPLNALFEFPTVEQLALRIDGERTPPAETLPAEATSPAQAGDSAARKAFSGALPPIVPVPRDQDLPLSFGQQRLWFVDRLTPGNPAYNIAVAWRFRGRVDAALMARSLSEIVRRHEVLRTRFPQREGVLRQEVSPPPAVPLPEVDLLALAAAGRRAERRRLAAAEAAGTFDLACGPVLRALLVIESEDRSVLLLTFHHIAIDAWSTEVLQRELKTLYETWSTSPDAPSPLPPLPVAYADFAAWQRGWLASGPAERGPAERGPAERQLAYWRRQLDGAPMLELPADRPRPARPTFRGRHVARELEPELVTALEALGRRHQATLFMTLLAAYQAWLTRVTGQHDVVVGTVINNRSHPEVEGLIGFFLNSLPLRGRLAGDPSFDAALEEVRETTLAAFAHQDLPYEMLVDELLPERDLSHDPFFQTTFTLQRAATHAAEVAGMAVEALGAEARTVQHDLQAHLWESSEGLRCAFLYNADLFDATSAGRLLSGFTNLLRGAAAHPEHRLRALPLTTPEERHQLLSEWSDSAVDTGAPRPFHQLLAAWAERLPDAIAARFENGGEGESLSYRELDRRANQLAHDLRLQGIGPEIPVGVSAEPSLELLVGLFGVLKAGGVYVPLDPTYPAERLRYMIADAGIALLLTQARLRRSLPAADRVLCLDADWPRIAAHPVTPPTAGVASAGVELDNLAYVIYTSGSTGRPKGTWISHRGWYNSQYALGAELGYRGGDRPTGDRVLQFSALGFDASIGELSLAVATGSTLELASRERLTSHLELGRLMAARGITATTLPPAMLAVLEPQLPALRLLFSVGEACSADLVQRWSPGRVMINGYGPTENTVCASLGRCDPASVAPPSIGRPVANARLRVLDAGLGPVPIGVAGEILLTGPSLARGYLGRPGLTAERWVPDHLDSRRPGSRLYRTGDLARLRADGALEFLGRIDHQVKIRGFRIELGEIEHALTARPEVRAAAVLAHDSGAAGGQLVAYVVPAEGASFSRARLRDELAGTLPGYMVPAAFVVLEALPRTANDKLDRRALPDPGEALAAGKELVEPRTPAEEMVAGIYARVLEIERVGSDDGFFELGGHSLLAAQVISRVRQAFGIELPLRQLFETPTVAELAAVLEVARAAEAGLASPPIERAARDGDLPLSFAQQRLWFLDQLDPGNAAYNIPLAFRLQGELDPSHLDAVFAAMVGRHEVLRTTFPSVAGRPIQRVAAPSSWSSTRVDLRHLGAAAEREAGRRAQHEAQRPFDLARGPLLRVLVLRLSATDHAVVVVSHHIVLDGSVELFLKELMALYRPGAMPATLKAPAVQYVDFAVWQRRWLEGEVLENQLAYWKRQLGGELPVLQLPTDRPRPSAQTNRGQRLFFRLPGELLAGARALSRDQGTTLYMTFLAVFDSLLQRYAEQDDVCVGLPVADRPQIELEGALGCFVNTLVLRADLSGSPRFTELLERVRATTLNAYTHQQTPFEILVEALDLPRDLSHNPLFQVMLVVHDATPADFELEGLEITPIAVSSRGARFDWLVSLWPESGGMTGVVEYNADLFDRVTLRRMASHLEQLLAGAVERPEARLGELPMLDPAERHQLLLEWNATERSWSRERLLHQPFEDWAERAPEAVAVVTDDESWSYRRLNQSANRIAHRLRDLGVGRGTLVGVWMERSPELVAALLAVLKAGGAYVPLDASLPAERGRLILSRLDIRHLLTRRAVDGGCEQLLDQVPSLAHVVDLDLEQAVEPGGGLSGRAEVAAMRRHNPPVVGSADDLAYVIFTSGSTGGPKGVVVRHRPVSNLIEWVNREFAMGPDDQVLFITSVGFDLSVYDVFGLLAAGGSLRLVSQSAGRDPERLLAILADEPVTFWDSAPAACQQLVPFLPVTGNGAGGGRLRLVFLSGDWIPVALPDRLRAAFPGARVISLGGATEATVWSNVFPIAEVDPAWPSIPYGRPIQNARYHVLDAALRPCPITVAGDLYIGGDCLASCYAREPALTAEKYLPDALGGGAGERLYQTGDRARYFAGGDLEFLGRLDHQVKIRGFRVELGEIEGALVEHPDVVEAVVLARQDAPGDRRLCAYLLVADGGAPDSEELREQLRRKLPEYMVPPAFVTLEAWPLTANGKLDRRALPAPAQTAVGVGFVAPRSPLEQRMAEIWASVLGLEQVGVEDSFFDLGGHSLNATELVHRLREAFSVELSLRSLFESPTVAALAELIAPRRVVDETVLDETVPPAVALPTLEPQPAKRQEPFPLTEIQQAYWIGRQGDFDLGGVSAHIYVELDAVRLDVGRLESALRQLIDRHDMLRAIVTSEGLQRILDPVPPFDVAVQDLTGLEPTAAGAALAALRRRMSHQILPSDRWPLFDLRVCRLDRRRSRLYVSLDVLLADAWSLQILIRDLLAFYHDPGLALPPLTLSFRDYVTALVALEDSEPYRQAMEYWRGRVAELPPAPDLPLARNPGAVTDPTFSRWQGSLEAERWERLKARARKAGVTPSGMLLAAFAEVLRAWSKSPSFTINLTLFNRLPLHPEVNQIVGDFTSATLLAAQWLPDATFAEQAQALQKRLWADLDHRIFGGVRVLRELARAQGMGAAAMMPVVFTSGLDLDPGEVDGRRQAPPIACEQVYSITQTPQVWLDHQTGEQDGALVFNWDVVAELFPAGMVDAMFGAYVRLLEHLTEDREAWQQSAPDLVPAVQLELRAGINETAVAVPQGLLHDGFLAQAAARPGRPAVIAPGVTLTYGELLARSSRLAWKLRRRGARPDELVAVVMEKGWEQVVAVLAILQAGAAYLPIDPDWPYERRRYVLQQGRARWALTQSALEERLEWPGQGLKLLVVDVAEPEDPAPAPPEPRQGPGNLAYVIFTSGSTGRPKGVVIDHRGALNTITDINRRFAVGPEDRVLALSSLTFDLSVYDLFGTLAAGGAIVLPEPAARRDPARWAALLASEEVTLWNSVPALMEILVEYLEVHPDLWPAALRLVLLSGDWVPLTLAGRIRAFDDTVRTISLGGATEASIWSIFHPIVDVDPEWKSIPYGRPLDNQSFHVLDQRLRPCPVWVPGSLYIGGVGLAQGYWRDEEKTRASFIVHPESGERLYRTGDLGRYLPDGEIEFLGRVDFQVKVQGYRIELGEIEAALRRHPAVHEAVAKVLGDPRGSRWIAAYVVFGPGRHASPEELAGALNAQLPDYMVPARFVVLDALPLSPNGKVDRQALPSPDKVQPPAALRPVVTSDHPVMAQIGQLVAQVLELETIDPEADLLALGLNSLHMVRIGNLLESELDFRPQIERFYAEPNVAALTRAYQEQQGAEGADTGDAQALVPASPSSPPAPALEFLVGEEQREEFKRRRRGLRADVAETSSVALVSGEPEEALPAGHLARRSHRVFRRTAVSLLQLGKLFSTLRSVALEAEAKYLYPSAGGVYPVQTYLHVKPGRVDGLEAGIYYHHPAEHRLVAIAPGVELDRSIHEPFVNRPIFDSAAFSIFLIARLSAIVPLYGPPSRDYCLIEAGSMLQTLMLAAPGCELGLCPIGGVGFAASRHHFCLEEHDELIHSILGGPIEAAGSTPWEPVSVAAQLTAGARDEDAEVEEEREVFEL